jgi:hypothetical protein
MRVPSVSAAGQASLILPGLPLPALPGPARKPHTRGVITAIDRDGRLGDRSPLTFMGWSTRRRLDFAIELGPIVVVRDGGDFPINPQGRMRLPLSVRRRCRIATRDRVLVLAMPQCGELLVIPMGMLDQMVAAYRRSHGSGAER